MVHAQLWNVLGAHWSFCSENTQRCVEVSILQGVFQTHIFFSQVGNGFLILPVCNSVWFDGRRRNNTPLTIQRREHMREVLVYLKSVRARRLLGITIAMTKNLACHIRASVSPIAESLRYSEFEDRRLRNGRVGRYRPFVYMNAQCFCLFLIPATRAPVWMPSIRISVMVIVDESLGVAACAVVLIHEIVVFCLKLLQLLTFLRALPYSIAFDPH
jgi:hypothetical protein